LIRAIAYRLQEQAFGGLKPSTRRQLARVAEETAGGNSPTKPQSRKAGTGTILVREWQGKSHHITVLDDGVAFNGKPLPFHPFLGEFRDGRRIVVKLV
jgi:hypothetical protein